MFSVRIREWLGVGSRRSGRQTVCKGNGPRFSKLMNSYNPTDFRHLKKPKQGKIKKYNKWLKISEKKFFLTPEEKTLHTGNKDRSTICFLSEVVQARGQWNAS